MQLITAPPGSTHAGFVLERTVHLAELNLQLLQLHHQKTGARLVHLVADDPNNLFAATFRTPPADSTGVAHILEHTVLCGSHRFPVRDPFFAMIKRSLNTFMNAMTSSDWTSYPFSTLNRKDFYNLLEVYLDAVFFPLLRERDFRQEGHRLEPADANNPDSPLHYQGVVYNEMKGAMASPSSLLSRRLTRSLYPTTTYRFNSGGEPTDIPRLTWEQLRDFHRRYYHPSNCWLLTYGSFPLEDHLEKLQPVLDRFGRTTPDSAIPPERRLDAPRRIEERYPIGAAEDPAGKTTVQVAWLTNDITDSLERLSLNLLSVLLLGNPAAPLYQALVESRLGANLAPGCGYHDENRTTYFAAGLQGTDPDRVTAIEELIFVTLQQVEQDGFARERIEGALHRIEFSNREVTGDSYPYPLILLMRMLGPWLHADDPVSPLQLGGLLGELRRRLADPGYLAGLIRRHLLDNRHRVTLVLRPDAELQSREETQLGERLARIREELTAEQRQSLADQAKELKSAQEADEDLSVLPTLQRSDIPTREKPVPSTAKMLGTTPSYWFAQPTNGIGYVTVQFTASRLSEAQLPYLPLLTTLLTQVGAAGWTYREMAARMEAATGGIHAGHEILERPDDADQFASFLQLRGKALLAKQPQLFEILRDICCAAELTDLERISTVLQQLRTSLENSIPGSGHSYAARAAASRLRPNSARRELWSGLTQIRLIKQLAARPATKLADCSDILRELAAQLFRRDAMTVAVTSEPDTEKTLGQALPILLDALAEGPAGQHTSPGHPSAPGAAIGYASALPVSYVARVYRAAHYTHPDAPALAVLAKLLRAGYLHREIREKGGAYGGMASYNPEAGTFSLLSYRDPQLSRTLQVYEQAAEWAAAGKMVLRDIDEAVLAVFSDLDRPLSPAGRGAREFGNLLQGLTLEMRQAFREGVLRTTRDDLCRIAARYLGGEEESAVAVIGSREALERANRELGNAALEIESI